MCGVARGDLGSVGCIVESGIPCQPKVYRFWDTCTDTGMVMAKSVPVSTCIYVILSIAFSLRLLHLYPGFGVSAPSDSICKPSRLRRVQR